MKNNNFFVTTISFILLIIGGIIYILYRPHSLYMFVFLKKIGLENILSQLAFPNNGLTFFCVYSLPNGLWLVSAILLFSVLWRDSTQLFLFYTISFSSISIFFELLQIWNVVPGTFDLIDLLVLLMSMSVGIFFYFIWRKGVRSEK